MIAFTSTRPDVGIDDSTQYGSELFTLVELLRWRAIERPDDRAFTFLIDGEEEGASVTFAELDRRARAIAVALQCRGAAGERALLLYPPGLEFIAAFFGSLYAGVVAVPANPPQSNKQVPRLQTIISDAEAKYVLTSKAMLARVERRFADMPQLASLEWVVTEDIDESQADEWREPALSGDTLAYLQYTSGSTSMPRGVMVSHENVLHNMACLDQAFYHPAGSVFVTWLPHFHDMGLIYGILEPVFKGFPCYLMPPASLIQQPIKWLRAITRYKATHSAAPNFAYAHCARRVRPEQLAELDLSSWQVTINGAEPVRKETIEQFIEVFGPCGFRRGAFCPGYGLAEASLMVSGTPKTDDPVYFNIQSSALSEDRIVEGREGEPGVQTLVSSGYVPRGIRVAIVDPHSQVECGKQRVGEIWVSGKSIAQGYWNRSDETERVFCARVAGTGEGPFMRTGDLGFIRDEQLYITGRIKDLIIIAGRNHYPQDIEHIVEESHAAIRPGCCAAFSVDIEDEERLVIAAEIDHRYKPASADQNAQADSDLRPRNHPPLDGREVARAIRQAVSTQNEVQPYAVLLLKAGTIPKTSSGKIQRHACGVGFQTGTLELWDQ